MRREEPVFIVGCARSGTSILFRTLLQHPAFATGQPDYTESMAVAALTIERDVGELYPAVFGFMGRDDERWAAFMRDIGPLRAWRRALWPLAGRWVARRPVWWLMGSTVVLRAYFAAAEDGRGVDRLVAKSADNVLLSRHIRMAFPRARMLAIVRHPADVLASYWRRHEHDANASWAAVSVDDFCARWETNAFAAARYARRWPDQFLVVRYEDFTGNAEAEFARICAFLGVRPAPDALRGTRDGFWDVEPLLYEDVHARSTLASAYVSADLAAEVESRLAAPMQALGYVS